jgi:NAD-specific glutamate dehydrogenase
MKKLRVLDLMGKRQLLSRQRATEVVNKLDSELANCKKITNDLEELANEKSKSDSPVNSYSFQAERQLVMKLMAQKQILLNRQDFLVDEISSASKGVSAIQAKIDFLEDAKSNELRKAHANRTNLEEEELQITKKR